MKTIIYIIFPVLVHQCAGWSGEAHRVIASVAAEFLSPSGKKFVSEHLCPNEPQKLSKSLVDISMYADSVEWSGDLHFSQTPKHNCLPFLMERDCGPNGRCIVTAIANYTMRAGDVSSPREDRSEALKFLVHLVADIHNPMHVGFAHDKGGNDIWLEYPQGKSLHHVWDSVLVSRLFKKDEDYWTLSRAISVQLAHGKAARESFSLNIDSEDIETLDAATRVAARMATQTATTYTCSLGYMNEKNKWIKFGDSLQEAYLESRSKVVYELIKFASIRLAEIINLIARKYFGMRSNLKNKNYVEPTAPSNSKSSGKRNQFLTLDFDFDADELVFDKKSGEDSATCNSESETVSSKNPRSRNFKKKSPKKPINRKSCNSNSFEETVEKEIAEKEKNIESNWFEGVDLSRIVLLKRDDQFIVTSIENAAVALLAPPSRIYTVSFSGNAQGKQSVEFKFDLNVFGFRDHSRELVARTLATIRNVDLDDQFGFLEEESNLSIEAGTGHRVALYTAIEVPYVFPPPPAEVLSRSNAFVLIANTVCFFRVERITLFVLQSTLESQESIMKTNVYQVLNDGLVHFYLIDEKLHDGVLGTEFFAFIHILRETKAHAPSIRSLVHRRTLLHELADLNTLFVGTDQDRTDTFKVVEWFEDDHKPEYQAYYRFHWSTSIPDTPGSPVLYTNHETHLGYLVNLCERFYFPILCVLVSAILAFISNQVNI